MSITYEYMVDWDATDWQATPDFSEAYDDISDYVKTGYIDRGKNTERGNCTAGTLDIVLDNEDKRFSPPYAASPLHDKIRPWLPVRVRATVVGVATYVVYTGFISRLKINPDINVQEAYLYCTDGMDLLARQMVTQDVDNRTMTNDGDACNQLLDAAGWPAYRRVTDLDGGSIVNFPATTEF